MNDDRVAAFERCELAASTDFLRSASEEVVRSLGIAVKEVHGAVATGVAGVDILAFNRVLGIGLHEPATPELIDRLLGWFEAAAVARFFVQVSPVAKPNDLVGWLESRGLSYYNNWVRLCRTTDDVPEIEVDLEIRRIGPAEAEDFSRIVVESFGWPPAMWQVIASAVGRPGWYHYMAYDSDKPAATGAFFACGDIGWFDFAATLQSYRGRGAQKALVARRLQDAAVVGCREAIVETGEPKPGKDTPSYNNMLKLGFETAYLRPNYICVRPEGG
jgi:GNAT superfamily N-acetyltransferase